MTRLTVLIFMALLVACGPGDQTVATAVPPTISTTSNPARSSTSITPLESDEAAPLGMLLVVGDWGSGTAPQGAVAGAMQRFAEDNQIEAVLTTGDNFYSDDGGRLIAPFDWLEQRDIPVWLTWGNHDVETSGREAVVNESFGSPPKWTTYEWGNVSVVILDSNQIAEPAQIDYLESELKRIDGPTIVVFHHPAYSCSRHGDNREVQAEWVERFDDDVLLTLSGHDHNYQRIEQGTRSYVVSGGGGRRLYDIEDCDSNLINAAELHHFVVLQQTDHAIQGTAVDVNGNPFDEFFINLVPGVLDD